MERLRACSSSGPGVERNLTVDPSLACGALFPRVADLLPVVPIIPVVTICARAFPVACLSRRSDHAIFLASHRIPHHDSAPARFIEDLQLRNRSPKTIETYVYHVRELARYFKQSPEQLGDEQIHRYLLHLLHHKRVSWSSYNQAVAALRFFYRVSSPSDTVVTGSPTASGPNAYRRFARPSRWPSSSIPCATGPSGWCCGPSTPLGCGSAKPCT